MKVTVTISFKQAGVRPVPGSAAVKGTVLTWCGLRGVSSGIFQ